MLEVNHVSLGYGATTVVHDVSLHLSQGEIGCLLGPSGCGKTTLLRAISGFEPVRAGTIALHGEVVARAGASVPPQSRGIGMVFQDHALFPHLTVSGNIAFGLHRMPASERQARIDTMLELVSLEGMGTRWPHELSGGQQQRVALARALAPQPRLVLMDEPFSSLDTSMRESIAREVRSILKRAQATALMVTHDQHEAFAMADNIGVMSGGQLMQWGSAVQVYCEPATRSVAQFIGEGALLPATATAQGDWQTALGLLPATHPHVVDTLGSYVLLRPEHVQLVAAGSKGQPATVQECAFRGGHFLYTLALQDGTQVLAMGGLQTPHAPGSTVQLTLHTEGTLAPAARAA